jgi:hypothetical protein
MVPRFKKDRAQRGFGSAPPVADQSVLGEQCMDRESAAIGPARRGARPQRRDHLSDTIHERFAPAENLMAGDDNNPSSEERRFGERRSSVDTRSDLEKQLVGERRSGADRRTEGVGAPAGAARPSDAQLALFARRLRRALRSDKGREFFGVARSEYDFAVYPEVLKTVEWIESLAGSATEEAAKTPTAGNFTLRKPPV